MKPTEFDSHVTTLGWVNIGLSVVLLFFGFFALFFLTGIGFAANDPEAARILGFVGSAAAAFFFALAIPGFFAGYGLLKRRSWARVVAIIVAVLELFNIPVGTAIGIYALWVLSDEQAGDYFAASAAA